MSARDARAGNSAAILALGKLLGPVELMIGVIGDALCNGGVRVHA